MRYLRLIVVITALILFAGGGMYYAAFRNVSTAPSKGMVPVVGSFYPLANFAENVGGERVSVTNVTPAGAEPHGFEPAPRQIAQIQTAKLFIMNGAGLDPWAEKLKPELLAKGVRVIDMSEHFHLLPPSDPHFWVDPVMAGQEVALIRDALSEIDPAHSNEYSANAAAYLEKLSALDQSFRTGLAVCEIHDVITSHAAFGYLAQEYSFIQVPIAGLSPDEEPSPKTLARVADEARAKNIKYIFFESLVSPKMADTLAQEIGAKTLVFDPLEGLTQSQVANGEDYISIQRQNLENLKIALSCK